MISSKIITSISTRRFQLGASGIVGLALAAALATGCQNPPAAAVADPGKDLANAGQSAPGALSVALVVPPNFQIDTIDGTDARARDAGQRNCAVHR